MADIIVSCACVCVVAEQAVAEQEAVVEQAAAAAQAAMVELEQVQALGLKRKPNGRFLARASVALGGGIQGVCAAWLDTRA